MADKLTLPEAIAALHKLALERPDRAARLRPLLDRLASEHRQAERGTPPRRAGIDVGDLNQIEFDMTDSPAEHIAQALGIPLDEVQEAIAFLLADRH
jgi:hypothetical protein